MQLESAVLYDAVFLLDKALEALNARNKEFMPNDTVSLSCNDGRKHQAGLNIINVMREVSFSQ